MRQTGPGNSLVRDQPDDGLIDDPRRARSGYSTGVLPVPFTCIRLESAPLIGATGCPGINPGAPGPDAVR